MQFLLELAKNIQSIEDEKIFEKYARSFTVFRYDNEDLGNKWLEHVQKMKIKSNEQDSEWHRVLREIRYWEDQELDYMYQRVMSLSRQILKKNQFFEVQTTSGKGTVPDRTTLLNRLLELSEELLSEIYPTITHLVNYKINDVEVSSSSIKGKIDWNKTITNAIKTSAGMPTTFISTIPERSFSTPENILLYIAITWLHKDATRLLNFQKIDHMSREDKTKIWKILNSTNRVLDSPLIDEINKESNFLKSFTTPSQKIKPILNLIEHKLKSKKNHQGVYLNLINWMKHYVDFNVNRYHNLVDFTFENLEDFDTMFELWILFEYLQFLKREYQVSIHPIIEKNMLKRIRVEKDGREFFVYYENVYYVPIGKQPGLDNHRNFRKPDFTIAYGSECICGHNEGNHKENEGKCCVTEGESSCSCSKFYRPTPIVMDAKNWRNKDRFDAVQKMGWYLISMNKYHSNTGILFFPTFEKNQDTTNPMTNQWGPIPINQGEWEFMNFVVKSSRQSESKEKLNQVFQNISNRIPILQIQKLTARI